MLVVLPNGQITHSRCHKTSVTPFFTIDPAIELRQVAQRMQMIGKSDGSRISPDTDHDKQEDGISAPATMPGTVSSLLASSALPELHLPQWEQNQLRDTPVTNTKSGRNWGTCQRRLRHAFTALDDPEHLNVVNT
jgi:hypothetical protein